MKILVTNDDGYMSKGLLSLVEILAAYGRITVVAPKKPQSGMSMAVSMGLRPIAVRELGEREGARWWYLDGTPASCIKFGIDNIFHPQVPDLVVSGINHGSNAATAALYSGTLGAAMEGAVNGIPSIGVSLDTFKSDADFSAVRRLLPGILDKLLDVAKPRSGMFYNINFPYIPHERIKGVRMCRMGKAHWEREYRPYLEFLSEIGKTPDPDAEKYLASCLADEQVYVMAGDFTSNDGNPDDADHLLLEQGYITITPHNIDNTDSGEYERLCAII
ncbi:MAG: 5'/3'-nucleotidase SurE [Bacteroides sp. CAG:1060_57_27]|nr:MAG: 5'/3'-nucleotidase SurE [Bacteroides sp. CAG:1060_57_27]